MTLSPMRRNPITSGEFNHLKSYMDDGFELTNEHIDNLEKFAGQRFDKIEVRINDFEKKTDARFAEQKVYIDDGFDKTNEHIDAVEGKVDVLKEDIVHLTKMMTKIDDDTAQLTNIVTKIAAKIL